MTKDLSFIPLLFTNLLSKKLPNKNLNQTYVHNFIKGINIEALNKIKSEILDS